MPQRWREYTRKVWRPCRDTTGTVWQWCRCQYARRIVNINANIIIAGAMAIGLTALATKALDSAGALEERPKWMIIAITFGMDLLFDVAIVFVLHWLANHFPTKWKGRGMVDAADHVIDAAPPPISFIKDATAIQFQRLCLSPILYAVAWSTQYWLLHHGFRPAWAFLLSYSLGVLVARALHTPWLMYSERRVWEQWEAAKALRAANNHVRPFVPPAANPPGVTVNGHPVKPAQQPTSV